MIRSKYSLLIFTVLIFILFTNNSILNAEVSLRESKKEINVEGLKACIISHNFYDIYFNPNGNFQNDFVDNGDGTITDKKTGLMWEKEGSSREKLFYYAIKYIINLNKKRFAGYDNWRLPTIEELFSLVKPFKQNHRYIDPVFSDNLKSCWSIDKSIASLGRSYPASKTQWTRNRNLIIDFQSGCADDIIVGGDSSNYEAHGYKTTSYVKAVRTIK